MKQVVILAGGQGTRLRERLGSLPKPLIEICKKPLLERQIVLAKKYGFNNVLILVNYQSQKIVEFCNSQDNWGLSIQCINDGDKPLGTAGAVLSIKDFLEDEFLVMYGDTMLEVDLDRFVQFHKRDSRAAATLFLHPNDHPFDSDLVQVDVAGNITDFFPYPHPENCYLPNLVNAALYCIRKDALKFWDISTAEQIDFGKNLFPMMLQKGLLLKGYNSPEYIKDCGTPKRVDNVCEDLMSGKIGRSALSNLQKAIFIDRDGTLNKDVQHLKTVSEFELFPRVESAIRKINKSEYKACVITNQPVIARGECAERDLRNIHNKMETQLGKSGAYLDRLYYCPHHPDQGYPGEVVMLKILCTCRKPKAGMIERAVSDLNLDLSHSWMVGDTTTDMELAKRVGLKSVLVQTGYAGLDGKYLVSPDFIVPTFSDAIDFIVDEYPIMLKHAHKILGNICSGEIIAISGQSRSGKTTIASIFKTAIEAQGKSCKIISTDRWLLGLQNRGVSFSGKHDLEALKKFISSLSMRASDKKDYKIPFYRKWDQHQVLDAEVLSLSADDVIIFEGVSLSLIANEFENAKKFFVDIDESVRRERVIGEYKLRGRDLEAATRVYNLRLEEEFSIINEFSINSIRISLGQLFSGVTG
jgi:histidinol-phosphate phosphatase family protein